MSEMKCKCCGANENRIYGFCSIMECETSWEYEDDIRDLTTRIAELEALVERLIEIGDWATIGMVISESYSPSSNMRKLAEDRRNEWEILVKEWKEREE